MATNENFTTFAVSLHNERDTDLIKALEDSQNRTQFIRDAIRKAAECDASSDREAESIIEAANRIKAMQILVRARFDQIDKALEAIQEGAGHQDVIALLNDLKRSGFTSNVNGSGLDEIAQESADIADALDSLG